MGHKSLLFIFFRVVFNTLFISLVLSVLFLPIFAQDSKVSKINSIKSKSNTEQKQRLDKSPSKSKIKVAAAQILTNHDDIDKNRIKIIQKIKEAKAAECEIVLFHEGCLTGYPDGKAIHGIDFAKVQQAEKEIINLAKELKIGVLLGSSSNEDDTFQNYVLIINEKGKVLGKYEKTWRAGEPHYRAGSGPVIFTIAGVEATVIICHDLRYPALTRLAVAAGAQIVFIANNEAGIFKEYKLLGYRSMQISRATENKVYSVMANSPADPQNILRSNCSHGNSKIVDIYGDIIDEANMFEERLVIGELDLNKSSRSPALRTMGQDPETKETYGVWCENPAYADWIQEGLKLVKRLNGIGNNPDRSVKIGEQIWMVENLNLVSFRNGDPILEARSSEAWEKAIAQRKPAWCYYGIDSTKENNYGKLYNWYAVNDPRGLAPKGWHVSSDAEWQILIDYLGGESIAGGKLKETGTIRWKDPNSGATNESGFSALPGGYRYHDGFYYMGYQAYFLTSTEYATSSAWARAINYDNSEVYRYHVNKWDGYSVRCIRD
jgi:uncharacterized protein (TIGR02145 family)